MNIYENIVIFDASLSDEAITEATDRIKALIASGGGEVLKVDPWGRRKLAYEINKHQRGFYTLFLFKAPSGVIKTLEELYKVFDAVVKFMVIRLEKKQARHALNALVAEAAQAAATAPAPEAPAASAPPEGEK